MNINLSSDTPVASAADDKFQRYNFSKRIAETINGRKSEDCIVVGIYGSWGEGKTSVLNFIDAELKKDTNTIVVKFNPWRYQDENMLLIQFFNKLAAGVDAQLKNKKEKIGDFLTKYAKIVSFDIPGVGNIGESAKAFGEALGADVEELKERVNEIIKKSGKRIVVIVDDIDRLDKNEIHAIFRLVKLTADFTNTTYILSFDEKMVAAAIGDRFAGGGVTAGQNFLEKIIQVPLRIPIVKKEIIENFCVDQIYELLKLNEISLEDYEKDRFRGVFVAAILPKLTTPRLASRYGNMLSFSVPLLKGEVNIVDLMLIEAAKIFYPDYYNFIRFNPLIFIDKFYGLEPEEEANKDYVDKMFVKFAEHLDAVQLKGILNLIGTIFPKSVYNFDNNAQHYSSDDFYAGKFIASPHYFERYFTYSVIEGDLSDVEVVSLVKGLPGTSDLVQEKGILDIFKQHSVNLFFRKVQTDLSIFNSVEIQSFSCLLARISSKLRDVVENENWLSNTPFMESVKLAVALVLIQREREESSELIAGIVASADNMVFTLEFKEYLIKELKGSFVSKSLDDSELLELNKAIIQRMLVLSDGTSIFKTSSTIVIQELLDIWEEINANEMSNYLEGLLTKGNRDFIDIIKSTIPWDKSPKPFKNDLNPERYAVLISRVDKEKLRAKILNEFSAEELKSKVLWNRSEAEQTDVNYSLQFLHYYEGNEPPTLPKIKEKEQ